MDRKFAPTPHYVLRRIADESILVPVSPQLKSRDCLFVLNATGYAIFSGIKSGLNVEQIEKQLVDSFDGAEPAAVREDMETLLSQMVEIEAIYESPRA
jgi:hypothetical protein